MTAVKIADSADVSRDAQIGPGHGRAKSLQHRDGKVAFAGGFGVRELGKKAPVDENTLFMVASFSATSPSMGLQPAWVEGQKTIWSSRASSCSSEIIVSESGTTGTSVVTASCTTVCMGNGTNRMPFTTS